MSNTWHKGVVQTGEKLASTIGFPTLNIIPPSTLRLKKHGVYACKVNIHNNYFFGALYFGPHHAAKTKGLVIEIHVFDFSDQIYGETIAFTFLTFIRPALKFSSMTEMYQQIQHDIHAVQKICYAPSLRRTSELRRHIQTLKK